MKNILAILEKELRIYFTTAIAYAGIGAFTFVLGLVFLTHLNGFQAETRHYLAEQRPELLERLNFNDQIIGPLFATCVWLFLFLVPFLSMRLFAEERQSRTFELLMTAPVSSLEIVLGKFLSLAVMMGLLAVLPLVFPLLLSVYGTGSTTRGGVEWAPVYSGVASLFGLGLCFAAVGLLVSALTESQVVAALLSFALLLMSFVLPMIAGRLEGDWRLVLEYLSPVSHVNRGLEGRVQLQDIVYVATTTCTLLFFTLRALESERWRG